MGSKSAGEKARFYKPANQVFDSEFTRSVETSFQVLAHEARTGMYGHYWKGGTEFWNLKNRYNMLVGSGWYIYRVKDLATGKTDIGKFAIIQ